ncbi:MAG TPA: hypothetical protein DCX95_04010 [Elusimicrobia bacterium]|nr:hypothetical protein [Elusimicrobiota bacterium]
MNVFILRIIVKKTKKSIKKRPSTTRPFCRHCVKDVIARDKVPKQSQNFLTVQLMTAVNFPNSYLLRKKDLPPFSP